MYCTNSLLLLLLFKVSNLDDVLTYHTDFLSSCLKDCMLTSPDLLKIVHKLLMVCVMFSNFMQVSLHLRYTFCDVPFYWLGLMTSIVVAREAGGRKETAREMLRP